jgi:iron complex outermembrane receptor protein
VSVSVKNDRALAEASIFRFSELQQQTPSLKIIVSPLSSSSTYITLRGQSSTESRVTADTAVAIYMDGVYYPHGFGTEAGDFWDIDRVEVLKGAYPRTF